MLRLLRGCVYGFLGGVVVALGEILLVHLGIVSFSALLMTGCLLVLPLVLGAAFFYMLSGEPSGFIIFDKKDEIALFAFGIFFPLFVGYVIGNYLVVALTLLPG